MAKQARCVLHLVMPLAVVTTASTTAGRRFWVARAVKWNGTITSE